MDGEAAGAEPQACGGRKPPSPSSSSSPPSQPWPAAHGQPGGGWGTSSCYCWRASEASETLSGVYKFELVRYVYIYIFVWRYVCHNSGACRVCVMWAELGHSHFLYVPAISNVVTNGNGSGTKNVLKGTMRFGLSLVSRLLSSRRYYCSESKTILYLDTVYCKFLLHMSVKINLVF